MILLDGKIASAAVKEQISIDVINHVNEGKRAPHLVAVLVGNNGASETYVSSKAKNCEAVGIKSTLYRLQEDCTEQELMDLVLRLNQNDDVDGILVQLPLPSQIDEQKIINLINPEKDVDGFSPLNSGRLMLGQPSYIPATPYGIMLMLEHYRIETAGKHAVVIGRSNIVGRPMSVLLSQNTNYGNCTVTLCHSRSRNLEAICREADILIAAIGIPGFVKSNMVKEGAVVVDVGITRVTDTTKKSGFAIKGDVDFNQVAPMSSYITPVPGGVGLMTIAALLKNTLQAYHKSNP
jgi:methylenetetrahydrofolate dehydrogenase (NADP+)/methenyltetrahydrofolate cyclohydrolase